MTLIEFLKEVDCVEIIITSYTEAEALEEVKQNGHALKYVHNQTKEICLIAVEQNGYALQYVHNQTKEICLAAVEQNGHALQYVHNQTKEICLAAVKQNGHALQYVDKSIFDAEPSTNSHTVTLNGLTYVLQG